MDKKSKKNEEGIIIIIALILCTIMMIVSLNLVEQNIRTVKSIKDSNNHLQAQATADSFTEYMNWQVSAHESGFSTNGPITCTYSKDIAVNGGGIPLGLNDPLPCQEFSYLYNVANQYGADIKVTFEIQGRNTTPTPFSCLNMGITGDCYVVPSIGNGSAGERCDYRTEEARGDIDHECNWNKLQFGSSLIDRATVPLYFDNGTLGEQNAYDENATPEENGIIIQDTFAEDLGAQFVVRVRTPCKPCSFRNLDAQGLVSCQDYVCGDRDRWELEADSNGGTDDVVVKWQITGECVKPNGKMEQCGMIQYVGPLKGFSGISESRINENNFLNNILLSNTVTNENGDQYTAFDLNVHDTPLISDKLQEIKKAIFTLFLSEKLLSVGDNGTLNNVPYLEYQILTNSPIADARTKMFVTVSVGNSGSTNTTYKEESKPIIDFAVQN